MEFTPSKIALIAGTILLSAGFYVGVTIVGGGVFCLILCVAGMATFVGSAVLFSREQAEEEAYRARSFERSMSKMKEAMLEEAAREKKERKQNPELHEQQGEDGKPSSKAVAQKAKEVPEAPKKPVKKSLPNFTGEEEWNTYGKH